MERTKYTLMLGMARWGAGWVMPLLRPALYLLALTSVLLLLLSAWVQFNILMLFLGCSPHRIQHRNTNKQQTPQRDVKYVLYCSKFSIGNRLFHDVNHYFDRVNIVTNMLKNLYRRLTKDQCLFVALLRSSTDHF